MTFNLDSIETNVLYVRYANQHDLIWWNVVRGYIPDFLLKIALYRGSRQCGVEFKITSNIANVMLPVNYV